MGITAGFDLNSNNDDFAPRVRKFVLGRTLSFDVPGFLDTSLLYYKEHNHNGIVGVDVNFKSTWMWASAWGIPIEPINARFNGFRWRNKFGRNAATGADYTAAQLAAEFHF